MVHQVTGPTDTRVGTETRRGSVNRDRGEGDTEPVEQEVITGTGDVGIPLNTKLGGLVEGQCGGYDREPSGFGDTTNKV